MAPDELPQFTFQSATCPVTPARFNIPLFSTPTSWPSSTPSGVSSYHTLSTLSTPIPSALKSTRHDSDRPRHKRKVTNDENLDPSLSKKHKQSSTSQKLSVDDKVELFFVLLETELKWTYGELLYHTMTSRTTKEKNSVPGTASGNSRKHAAVVQHFLNGHGKHAPSDVVKLWMEHPYGRKFKDSPLMFSTTTPYTDIKPVRPALTSFAAQLVEKQLVREVEQAVKPSSGLHLAISTKTIGKTIGWTDIGATTVEETRDTIKQHQPLTWALIMKLASRPPRVRNGITLACKDRPPDVVSTGVISTINFSRSSTANRLPLASGILQLGAHATFDTFRHGSRFGLIPSYATVLKAMRALSAHEAKVTRAHGMDPNSVGCYRGDNSQHYHVQRDHAIGRENKLIIGFSATYYEVEGVNPEVFDLDAKRKVLAQRRREKFTFYQLTSLLDQTHLENVLHLQWIDTLIRAISHLNHMKSHIAMLYKTRVAKQRLPVTATKVHPLGSSSKKETVYTEFKDVLFDILEQTGQTKENFFRRMKPVGGDGMTFDLILQLQQYLQFHESEFESLEILEPMLEWWHTEWTDVCRVFESHWGSVMLSDDPSSLGHSADKIGRKKPSNLKKVDYGTGTELAYLVLDARILDCWRIYFGQDDLFAYFNKLALEKKLPTFEDLEAAARKLYRSYTSTRAQHRAMQGNSTKPSSLGDPSIVPPGSPWTEPRPVPKAKPSKRKTTTVPQTTKPPEPFKGDQVLARSIAFMREAMISREAAMATADGDVGRLYEAIKVMLFTFAGSNHSNYTSYLLEVIAKLELECSADLRHGLLQLTLVNLSGKDGHFAPGDYIQEYFNRLLEAVVQRKGVQYGDAFIRELWARNLHHIARLKATWLGGVGLSARTAQHSGAKTTTEMKRLRDGKLSKWITKTTRSRGLKDMDFTNGISSGSPDAVSDDEELDNDDNGLNDSPLPPQLDDGVRPPSLSAMQLVDGQLVSETLDLEEETAEIIRWLEYAGANSDAVFQDDSGDEGSDHSEMEDTTFDHDL
ncbi:hypothetical protein Hypma_002556 [Hypsizygus marmoreus]|uniref:DUF6589 domain-containing protein n=1 Tax=Hypsizygus marmoreus TaxID=39966 RepID=A0A369J8F9_HYPMA|nr:hypothetical protein Hypma_002556 [Hypsizygus marmoreus]